MGNLFSSGHWLNLTHISGCDMLWWGYGQREKGGYSPGGEQRKKRVKMRNTDEKVTEMGARREGGKMVEGKKKVQQN